MFKFFRLSWTFLVFRIKITFFIASKPVFMKSMEYNHRKLPKAFIDFQHHFSSNGSKKAKLLANCILTQNSIYSMPKKTMLFTLRQNDTYWTKATWWWHQYLDMKVAIIWSDAVVLVTPSLENSLKLMHTPTICIYV